MTGKPFPPVGRPIDTPVALAVQIHETSRSLERAVRLLHRSSLSPAQYDLLRCLELFEPLTIPQLARKLGTSRQHIQAQVKRLSAKAYVVLSDNPEHQRSFLVRLNKQGTSLCRQQAAAESDFLQQAWAQIPEARIISGIELLRDLCEQLQPKATSHTKLLRKNVPASSQNRRIPRPVPKEEGLDHPALQPELLQLPVNLL